MNPKIRVQQRSRDARAARATPFARSASNRHVVNMTFPKQQRSRHGYQPTWVLPVVLVVAHSLCLLQWRFEFDCPWTIIFLFVDMPACMLYGALQGLLKHAPAYLIPPPAATDYLCFWGLGNLQWLLIGWLGLHWKRIVFPRAANEMELGPRQCSECGYDLRGNVSGVCPECGRRIADG